MVVYGLIARQYYACARLIPGLMPSSKSETGSRSIGADTGVFNRHLMVGEHCHNSICSRFRFQVVQNQNMVPTCLNIRNRLVQENISGCVLQGVLHNQKLSRRYRPVNDVILVHYCNTTWYGVERDDISVQCSLYSQVQDVTTVWYYLFTSCTIIRLHIAPIC